MPQSGGDALLIGWRKLFFPSGQSARPKNVQRPGNAPGSTLGHTANYFHSVRYINVPRVPRFWDRHTSIGMEKDFHF